MDLWVPRPPLIGFNLGRGVGWVTYTCKYGECASTSKEGGNTGSTHILLGVFVSALSVMVSSQPVVQIVGWHRSIILCDVMTYHGIQFINSLCGLLEKDYLVLICLVIR